MCMLLVKRCSLDHRSEAMAGTATRWAKVMRGNAVEYETPALQNVGALLKEVKKTETPKLDNVAIGDLTLHEYEGGPASSAIQFFPIARYSFSSHLLLFVVHCVVLWL
jgi:hypothetical protein